MPSLGNLQVLKHITRYPGDQDPSTQDITAKYLLLLTNCTQWSDSYLAVVITLLVLTLKADIWYQMCCYATLKATQKSEIEGWIFVRVFLSD